MKKQLRYIVRECDMGPLGPAHEVYDTQTNTSCGASGGGADNGKARARARAKRLNLRHTLAAMDEPALSAYVGEHGKTLAEGECRITYYNVQGLVYCRKSVTQCHYCGELASWKLPEHARPVAAGKGGGA